MISIKVNFCDHLIYYSFLLHLIEICREIKYSFKKILAKLEWDRVKMGTSLQAARWVFLM